MSQIVTLYSDKERTDALYPRTKVSAISDDNNTPLKELMTGTVKQEEGGTEEEVVTPINADTLGGKLTANNVVFYEEEMVDEFGQVVVRNADKLENHPASYFAASTDMDTKANKSDVLTYEEIQASTDLSGKIASASALKDALKWILFSDQTSGKTNFINLDLGSFPRGLYEFSSLEPSSYIIVLVDGSLRIILDGGFSASSVNGTTLTLYTNSWNAKAYYRRINVGII